MNSMVIHMPHEVETAQFHTKAASAVAIARMAPASGSALKFRTLTTWLMNRPADLTLQAQAMGCLLVFDGIFQRLALIAAFEALPKAFRVGDRVMLQWNYLLADPKTTSANNSDDLKRRDERQLSAWTILTSNQVEHWPSGEEALCDLDACLRRARLVDRLLPDNLMDAISVVKANLQLKLQSFLYAHCLGKQMLTPLPTSAYVRFETKLAPQLELDERLESGRALREVELAEATHALAHSGRDHQTQWASRTQLANDSHLFSAIKSAFGSALSESKGAKSDVVKKRLMIDLLDRLNRDAKSCSWWGQLVWHTTLHLFTQFRGDGNAYAASSFPRIFYGGAEVLYRNLQPLPPGEICSEAFTRAVQGAAVGMQNTGHLHAFANCMVDFLAQFDLIDPLYFSASRQLPAPVKANTVWDHEFDCMFRWLDEALTERPSSRVLPALCAALEVCDGTGIRSNELQRIRLDRIAVTKAHIQITLDPLRSDAILKTDGSRRRVFVQRTRRGEGLLRWIVRRLEEEGLSTSHLMAPETQAAVMNESDLASNTHINRHLFGMPGTPGHFRDLPVLLKGLSMMLKSATGDPEVSVHTTRHAFVSDQVEVATKETLKVDGWGTTNPLAEVGTRSGHKGHRSLLLIYSHQYASLIRQTIDDDVVAQGVLSPTIVSKWIPSKRNTLQKQLGRCSQRDDSAAAQVHLMNQMASHARTCASSSICTVSSASALQTPSNPLSSIRDHELDLTQTLCAIEDLLNISDELRISLRRGLTPDQTKHLMSAFDQAEALLGAREDHLLPRPARKGSNADALAHQSFRTLWMKFGFRWRQFKWEKLLSHLETVRDDPTLDGLVDFWVSHPTLPHFALPADRKMLNTVFGLLREADFRADHVHIAVDFEVPVIGVETPDTVRGASRTNHWLDAVSAAYYGVFHVMPTPVQRRRRGDRPGIYLLLGSKGGSDADPEQIANGAGLSTQGLHAIFLALFVYRTMTKGMRHD